MDGRVCLITGANSGIGKAAAAELVKMGATLVMVCRNREKGDAALAEIKKQGDRSSVELMIADLSSLQAVRQLAVEFRRKYSRLNVLINNAGLFNLRRHVTADGYEVTFATNYLSPFLLTHLLLDELKASEPSRIVNVSSVAHYGGHIDFDDLNAERGYSGFKAYSQSKLALILFTRQLAKKLDGTGIAVYSLHPGAVATNIWSRPAGTFGFITAVPKLFMARPKQGDETVVYLASFPHPEGASGEYYEKKRVKKSSRESYDSEVAERLWKTSVRLTRLE
ncbi:MAG: SDR family oxidoreductase [Thaumarchaeota archaeon]|nr:SDR family oxidoreductase [Nitrososphaerota archaeon]